MCIDGVRAGAHQQPDRRRTDPQMSNAMALDHRPDPISSWEIGSPFENDKGNPVEPATDDFPRPHHPADICEPPHQVFAGTQIEVVAQLLAHLGHATCVSVNRPLRLSGGSTGIDHQCWIHRLHHLGHGVIVAGRDGFLPPEISPDLHRRGAISALEDDHV